MSDTEEIEWMQNAPDANLLETDIRSRSFNIAPWDQRDPQKAPWKSSKLILAEEYPFSNMVISDTSQLAQVTNRSVCPQCKKSRKYYCYTCYVPLIETRNIIPHIESIPIKIDVVKHAREVDGKSTATHAAVICPKDVRIFIYPDIPDYSKEKALLLFPGPTAKPLKEIFSKAEENGSSENPQFERIVFIDCTWNQTKRIYSDERLASLPQLIIDGRNTAFWRYQKGKPKEHLGTIEAIYYFLRDYHTEVLRKPYHGNYDNILFLFKFMFDQIHQIYGSNVP